MKELDLAKNRWSSHLADRIHQMAKNSRDSCQTINNLKRRYSKTLLCVLKKDGTFTETDEEQVEILFEQFQNVYNRKWNNRLKCPARDLKKILFSTT